MSFQLYSQSFKMKIKVLKEKLITVYYFKTQNFTDRSLRLWIPNALYMKNM